MFLEEAADAEGHCHKGEDVNHPLKVSLEDLYNGKMVKLAVSDQAMDGEATMFLTWDILTPLLKLLWLFNVVQSIGFKWKESSSPHNGKKFLDQLLFPSSSNCQLKEVFGLSLLLPDVAFLAQ
jgi:hypothetical protein